MPYAESILDLVGNTPLVRITRVDRRPRPVGSAQPTVLAKLEMLNPGGSVKDRIGLPMIEAAERDGPAQAGRHDHRADLGQHRPRPGDRRRAQGLPLHLRDGRQAVVREAAAPAGLRRRGRALPDQRRAGIAGVATTASPPGWRATSRARSSPTSTGTWRTPRPTSGRPARSCGSRPTGPDHPFRRERRHRRHDLRARRTTSRRRTPAIVVIGADPEGSVLSGRHRPAVPDRGRRRGLLPGHVRPTAVDRWVRVSDRDAFAMARRLTREEGILSGGSCGTAMVAAREVVRDLAAHRRRARGRGRRAAPRQRPELPLEALQRRVDARERPAGDGRGDRPRRDAARATATTRPTARPWSWPARRSASATPSRRSRPSGSASCRCPRRRPATTSPGWSGRSASAVSWTAPIATRWSSSGPSARSWTRRCRWSRRRPRSTRRSPCCQAAASALVAVRAGRPVGVVTKLDLLEYLAHHGAPGA